MARNKPVGAITRGTTNPNRLRRVDRYLTQFGIFRQLKNPLAVDLGYGRTPVTTVELLARLQGVNPDFSVLGIEIDPERVLDAKPLETAYTSVVADLKFQFLENSQTEPVLI
jgi:tRNA G46 methylase TrmB